MKSSRSQATQRKARARWIAVGDASRFVIYEKEKGRPLSEVRSFTNESAHQKVSDLVTGQPGRSFDSFSKSGGGHQTGVPRHAYTREQDPKAHAVETFLRTVAVFLDQGCDEHSFENLVLVMNSRLLGNFRSFLSDNTRILVSEEHAKDFAWISGPELENRVESLLALA